METVAPYGFVVHADGTILGRALSAVVTSAGYQTLRGFFPLPASVRTDPALRAAIQGRTTLAAIRGARVYPDGRALVRVFPYQDQNAVAVFGQVERYAVRASDPLFAYPDSFYVSAAQVNSILANVPGVAYIELVYQRQLTNDLAVKDYILNIQPA